MLRGSPLEEVLRGKVGATGEVGDLQTGSVGLIGSADPGEGERSTMA